MKICKLDGLNSINIFINEKLYVLENGKQYEDIIADFLPQYFKLEENILHEDNSLVQVIIETEE